MRSRRLGSLMAVAGLVGLLAAWPGSARAEAPAFGPAGSPITPGVQLVTAGQFCTANFVFADAAGRVYLGQAAHCARLVRDDEGADPTGCSYGFRPLGTPVSIPGTGVSGRLAYLSWQTMQDRGERDRDACQHNDFALVEVPAHAIGDVHPAVPVVGGPNGLNTSGTEPGDLLRGYGSSPARQEVDSLKPKHGVAVETVAGGWAHVVYALTPGIPGDSGGPFLDADGDALGSATLLVRNPPGANVLTDIAHALAYAAEHSGIDGLHLVELPR